MTEPVDCQCDECKSACVKCPGWFMPGEVEKAADLKGMSLQDFFEEYLSVNWWVDSPDVFLLSPASINGNPGDMAPYDPHGKCVFYEDGLCGIHDAKPFECRQFIHEDSADTIHGRHESVADAWREQDYQDQITAILGYEPYAGEVSMFSGLFGF